MQCLLGMVSYKNFNLSSVLGENNHIVFLLYGIPIFHNVFLLLQFRLFSSFIHFLVYAPLIAVFVKFFSYVFESFAPCSAYFFGNCQGKFTLRCPLMTILHFREGGGGHTLVLQNLIMVSFGYQDFIIKKFQVKVVAPFAD